MYINFEEMAPQSRIWIYQADRKLNTEEAKALEAGLQNFLSQWAAHGKDLKSSGKVFHHQFLVLAVDENFNAATGCSIDSSVAFVKEAEQKLNVSFFDRTKVAFLAEDEVYLESLQQIKQKVEEGKIKPDTPTFNNLVTSKAAFDEEWVVEAKDSWLSRYF